jgi:hypothetical protein
MPLLKDGFIPLRMKSVTKRVILAVRNMVLRQRQSVRSVSMKRIPKELLSKL